MPKDCFAIGDRKTRIGSMEIIHTLLLVSEDGSVMRVILRSPARIHSSPEVFRRAVWQLGPKSRVHSCVSFPPPQSHLTLLLFSLLHACHSCRPLRQRQRAAFFVRAAPLQSIFRHIFPAPCVMTCAFLRPQVLRHHPPSCGCGRTHRALRNVLPPRAS